MTEKLSNMASPLPWFRMFASNYLADRSFRTASLEERGLIISMMLECWASVDVPKDPGELSQILGVSVDQVGSALTPKTLSFFKSRGDSYYSEFLDDQRKAFLTLRQKQIEGGQKGASIKKSHMKASRPDGQPLGQSVGSLNDITSPTFHSPQINTFPVDQKGGLAHVDLEQHREWIDDYENADDSVARVIK